MTRCGRTVLLLLATIGLSAMAGCAANPRTESLATATGRTVRAADGLCLDFAADGTVRKVMAGNRTLPLIERGGFYVTEVLPPEGRPEPTGLVRGEAHRDGDAISFEGSAGKGLTLRASVSGGDALFIDGTIRDETGRDRATIVEFVLPIDLAGWIYENTPLQMQRAESGTHYPSLSRPETMLSSDVVPPEEKEVVWLDMGRLPFNAVHDDRTGLSFGVPMSQPRVFRMTVEPRGLVMRFCLGISPATEKFPSEASFHFCVYRSDPTWGIRSAAEGYYHLYPEQFATKARKYGSLREMNSITTKLPNKQDFGVSYGEADFQWTQGQYRPAVAPVVKELGLEVFHWREPWSWFDPVPREMTPSQEVARWKAQAGEPEEGRSHGQYCGAPQGLCAAAALNSVMEDEAGQPIRVRYEYGSWMLAVNLDPELPHPNRADVALKWQFPWLDRWDDPQYCGPRNYAWDSATGWTGIHLYNYRADHFRTVDNPLTFDSRTGRLCQLKAMHDWEFARLHAGLVRAKGGLICANTSPMATLIYGQYMDVLVREEAISNLHDDLGIVLRMLAYHKPVAFYFPPTDVGPVRLAMFYDFAPGIDATEESMRSIARQYMPIIQRLGEAGWQPVTRARGERLLIERYGQTADDLYLTVRLAGPNAEGQDAAIRLEAREMGIDPKCVVIEEIAEGRAVHATADGGMMLVTFHIAPGETLVMAVRSAK